ncbi:MAG: hypothetical protein V1729_06905 [Candidatus Woesearchaeota archaeon]
MIHCMRCNTAGFTAELVFAVLIIVLCLMIYFRTRGIYNLTRHKGMGYFRNTFLFFAIAFLSRLVFHLLMLSGIVFDFHFPRPLIGPLPLLFTSYFSTIAILYLLLSLVWKKVDPKQFLIVSHAVAISVSVLVFLFHSPYVLVIIQLFLITFTLVLAYLRVKHSKSFSRLFAIYLLLFVGWLSNIFILGPRWRIPFDMSVVLYLISLSMFSIIFYKVYRWTR